MNNYYKYLPVTDLEKKWGFYITTAGYTKINPKEIYPPVQGHPPTHAFTWNKGRILDGYYLVFISKGQGIFESANTKPYVITAGTCFFLFPHIWHRYRPDPNSGWEEYWVGFKGKYPDNFMVKEFFNPYAPFVEAGLNESLLDLFQKLFVTIRSAQPGYQQVISGITLEMMGLIHTISLRKKQSDNPNQQLIDKATFLLRESLDKSLNMQELARALPMGYSKFRKEFKNLTGSSPHDYHLSLRMNKAKELLNSTTLTINEIAFQTGFESVFYFSKLFKRKTGLSPRWFRVKKEP